MFVEYRTLRAAGEAEFTERRSRFIGRAAPVHTEEEALAFLREIRARCWDATHNVYAYVLRENGTARFSDDGEPQGTSGMPTLDVLQKSGVTDAIVVTTRYFGGILLGAGGLVRAYSRAAHDALAAAGIVQMRTCKTAVVRCDYAQYSTVARALAQAEAAVDRTDFLQEVSIAFHLPPNRMPALTQALADATAGRVAPETTGEAFFAADSGADEHLTSARKK